MLWSFFCVLILLFLTLKMSVRTYQKIKKWLIKP
uniref:Uncharacterized protein n=1 Tax=Siphoviridae sp. ctVDC13 TaxID=2827880 RepID=A0A8S5TDQ2_9CAUD|nr:MAG TPA: hypothetical protein [Siphoviridae sp. ctVDC13]